MDNEYSSFKDFRILNGKRIIGMINNSFNDYLAARVLLNNGLLIQGCIVACTSIEKYLKGILLYHEGVVPRHHEIALLYEKVRTLRQNFPKILSTEFLSALQHIYKARYLGDMSTDYNFVILQRKFLAELDYTYSILNPVLRFKNRKAIEFAPSLYDSADEDNDPRIKANNFILLRMDKVAFVEQKRELVHELRIAWNGEVFEAQYPTDVSKCDGIFRYEGLVFDPDNRSARYTHQISPDTFANAGNGKWVKVT